MKNYRFIVFCLSLLFVSCAQQSDIANLQSQIDELKSGRIASIESQVSSINASISSLQEADREIKGYITALQNTASELQKSINTANGKIDDLQKALSLVNTAIETLQAKDSALEKRIDDLKDYVDTQLKNAKDWVSATFATLEQYNGIVSEIGGIKGSISAINTTMEQMESRLNGKIESTKAEIESAYTKAIGTLDTSMKNWVNDQLKGYWTIAETEGKLAALKGSLEKEDESLKGDIDKLSTSLDSAKTELTEGYKAAIKKAIDENNGLIDGKISEAVSGLNTIIDSEVSTINKRIDAMEKRIANLETQVSALVSRIQSLTYIPRYTDGASTMWVTIQPDGSTVSRDTLEFRVSPADCADSLVKVWDKAITAEAVSLITRGTQETISLPVVSVSGGNGKLSVVLDGRSLGEKFFTGKLQMKAVVVISDGNNERTSEYISIAPKEYTNNIIRYTSKDGKIVIPYRTDGFGANLISNEYKNGRGTILFDGDVTSIGNWAFGTCSGLVSIEIPNSVTIIEYNAFDGCSGLADITIPNSVTSIGYWAFVNCSSLSEIKIPSSVTSLGKGVFMYCRGLSTIIVDSNNPNYDSRNNCNAIIETNSNTLISGCKETIIPNSVERLDSWSFTGIDGITTIEIPNSVKSIGVDAFLWCHYLTSVVIPDSLTSIEGNAFWGTGLTSIMIPKSLTSISITAFPFHELSTITVDPRNPIYDSRDNCNAIIETESNTLFKGCINTVIPNTVTSIGRKAFEDCSGLTTIEIPSSVATIGEDAFRNCSGLTSIDIPNSVTTIGECAFYECSGLTTIEIPSSVATIGSNAFRNCSGLTTIEIPSSVATIGDDAFRNCSGLTSITLLATTPCKIGFDIFENTNDCPLYVPSEAIYNYYLAPNWKYYKNRIQAIP
jgi:predicted  nucleic acid-binding Zn-ribbon protein